MTLLVTGSAGHLGEGLMRELRATGRDAVGVDIKPSEFTDHVGSITDRDFVRRRMRPSPRWPALPVTRRVMERLR